MQVIIPMSGIGSRFLDDGYKQPKFMIELEGKPIIQHVVELFPNETDFLFICNNQHLNDVRFDIRSLLKKIAPQAQIVGIQPHKLGPVFAVLEAADYIKTEEPVIVNYCDFACYWDYQDFLKMLQETNCAGAIPAYKGFHPHSLGNTKYAYLTEKDLCLVDIREKEPFTENHMDEFASSGTYYFKTGALMQKAMRACIEENLSVDGEYYVSLCYKILLREQLIVRIYELEHFMQWGTPEDVKEYNQWSSIFKYFAHHEEETRIIYPHSVIVPSAGTGSRFADAGYKTPKPLIPVMHKPMLVAATNMLPKSSSYVFIMRKAMENISIIEQELSETFETPIISLLENVTNGQAITCRLGLEALKTVQKGKNDPITFSACDNGIIFNHDKFGNWLTNGSTDVLVWGTRSHFNAKRSPESYGWISEKNLMISEVSVKKPLNNISNDPIITGTFTFRNADIFLESLKHLENRNGRVNDEFYLDSCINDAIELGYSCEYFEVDHYISWGTPVEFETFKYWENCFSKWFSHPFHGF